ncbi:MAG: DUF47 family protein [Coriobacteriia bacterium]|nr:DUF47 family protein [Coriobacteriia bacterium]
MAKREKFDYFSALERHAGFSSQEARLLVEVLENFDPENLLEKVDAMHEIENAADQQNHELFTHIATEFLTPIEREDIAELALRIDDIADYIDDVTQQLYMYNIQELYPPALEIAILIERATLALVEALKEFRNFRKSRAFTSHVIEVNSIEEEADKIYFRTIRDLYSNHTEQPVFIMAWSSIFLRMERCIDSCENVVDMLGTIILKNS